MTKDELNFALAESLESKPVEIPDGCDRDENLNVYLSHGRCWQWVDVPQSQWEPRDFTREPELTVIMVEWLVAECGLELRARTGSAERGGGTVYSVSSDHFETFEGSDFQLLIAEACARARGLWSD